MEQIDIQSYTGIYSVYFCDEVIFEDILREGDIVVCDRTVFQLYEDKLKRFLRNDNSIIVDATEENKSYEGIIPIIDKVIAQGFHKNNRLISIGGGIIQDIVAFISSVLYRGVQWIHVPTTLLAQCDSCIGSKTSINFRNYKNQIGGFYPPKEIYICTKYLSTLGDLEIKSGLGEMLHYYVVAGEKELEFYELSVDIAMRDAKTLEKLIKRSLEIKKSYIEIDEYDKNERQIFNYGHSFGHAIESVTEYRIPHGIAVSYGMDIANYVSVKMGLLEEEKRRRIRQITEKFWDNSDLENVTVNAVLDSLRKDKKNKGSKLGLILCSGYGKLAKFMVDADDAFVGILNQYFAEEI